MVYDLHKKQFLNKNFMKGMVFIMDRYDLIVEELQRRIDAGELSLEDANKINDEAFAKYVGEEASTEDTDTDEQPTLEQVLDTIDEYLTEAKNCKVATGETVIGADKKSDTNAGNGDFAHKNIEASESNVSPEEGLGSKKYSGQIDSLVDFSDSQKETDFDKKMRDTRLRVYEAFEVGIIDEEEKSVMLEMLDLENYK